MSAEDAKNFRELVNSYIKRFGDLVSVTFDPLSDDGYTSVKRGSATVGINVLEEQGVLLFLSQILDVPKEEAAQLGLFRKLLELNLVATGDGAFAIDKDKNQVYLRAYRGLEGLDFEEFVDMLDTVATVADGWDDKLRETYQDR